MDSIIVFSHFARRKGVQTYRPTAHDRACLEQLRRAGCSQSQVLAAIDLAFDSLVPGAPPIRQFAYCGPVALKLSATTAESSPPAAPAGEAPSHRQAEASIADGGTFPSIRDRLPAPGGITTLPHHQEQSHTTGGDELPPESHLRTESVSVGQTPENTSSSSDVIPESTAATSLDAVVQSVMAQHQREIGPVTKAVARSVRRAVVDEGLDDPQLWDVAFEEGIARGRRIWAYVRGVARRMHSARMEQPGRSCPLHSVESGAGIECQFEDTGHIADRPIQPVAAEEASLLTETASAADEAMWHQALGELQLQMTKAAFDTWVKQTRALGYRNTTLIIGVQNGYVRDWLKNRLKGVILRTVKGMASGEKIRDIDCVVAGNSSPQAGNGRS